MAVENITAFPATPTTNNTNGDRDSNGCSFIIKELFGGSEQRSGAFETKPLSEPIEWTLASYAKPRETWKIKKTLRTSRYDYSSFPSEQILGIKYEDFTLSGVWDNKYNGGKDVDFAWQMKESFESLQDRGNPVVFSFNAIEITGIIKEFEYEFITRSKIGYSFTVSPHHREKNAGHTRPPKNISFSSYDFALQNAINQLIARQALGPAAYMIVGAVKNIQGYINMAQQAGQSKYDQISQYINACSIGAQNVSDIINNRLSLSVSINNNNKLLINGNGINNQNSAIQRLVQELTSISAVSIQMIDYLRSARSSADLIYQDATQIMSYEMWKGSIVLLGRQILEICFNASADLQRLIENDIQAVYRPSYHESLYAISQMFYGTPDLWRIIYSQNQLEQLVLQGDEILIIPKIGE